MTNAADHPATRRLLLILGGLALVAIGAFGALALFRGDPPRSPSPQVTRVPTKPDEPTKRETNRKSGERKADGRKSRPKRKTTKPRPGSRPDAFKELAKMLGLCRCTVAQLREQLEACECTVGQLHRRLKERGAGALNAQATKDDRGPARRAKRRAQRRQEEEGQKTREEDDDPPPGADPEDDDDRGTGGRPAPVPAPPNDLGSEGASGAAVAVPGSR